MKRKHLCQALSLLVLAIVCGQVISLPFFKGNEREMVLSGGTLNSSQIETEEIQIVLAMPDSYDLNERIYAVAASIRNAKATYVKPLSVNFEILSKEFEEEFVIGENFGEYDESGSWVTINQAEVERLNDFIYFTSFDPFLFDALLTMRVTVEWLAPWGQVLTAVTEKDFTVGSYFNVTNVVDETRDDVRRSVLDKVDLGIDFAVSLVENVDALMDTVRGFVEEISQLVNFAGIDPGLFNIFVIDLIGNSTNRGPLYEVVKHDMYSHLSAAGSTRDDAMDARHDHIIKSINASLSVLDNKIGSDTDASDGYYNYTISFVREIYEEYAPDAAFLDPSDTVDSVSKIVYFDEQGNVTGGSFDDAYAANGDHEVSLEFLLEPLTGAHPKFKSPLGAKRNIAPPRKSIILNTMGSYFPIMNSWYDYYELDATEFPDEQTILLEDLPTGLGSGEPGEFRRVLDDTDPMLNMRRLVLKYDLGFNDIGSSVRTGLTNDMFDNYTNYLYDGYIQDFYTTTSAPIVNHGYWVKKLGQGMTGGFYYWVNLGGGNPFSKMTRDADIESSLGTRISDGSHDVIVTIKENPCETFYLSGTTITPELTFDLPFYNKSMFQMIDSLAMITGDYDGLNVKPELLGPTNTEFYKIDTGRWIDAFFNGTDISLLHGDLNSSTYITAAHNTTEPWYSPKEQYHAFVWEDVWAFYRLGELDDYNLPNEYSWVPFVGPNNRVPIGWMTSSDMWYSIVATDDLRMGLSYLYGGIFMGYKQTVLSLKNIAMIPVLVAMQGTGIPEARLQYLVDQSNALDDAWANLDLRLIDDIGENIVNELSNRGIGNGGNIIEKSVERIANLTNLAYAIVGKDENEYSFIDTGLDTAGSDLEVAAVGDALKNLIETNIRPALKFMSDQVQKIFSYFSTIKGRVWDSVVSVANGLFDAVDNQINNFAGLIGTGLEFVGSGISQVASDVNETMVNTIGAVAGWTQDQITNLGQATKSGFGFLHNIVDDVFISGLETTTNFVADASISISNGIGDKLGDIETFFEDRAQDKVDQWRTTGAITGGIAGGAFGWMIGADPVTGAVGGAALGGAAGEGIGNLLSTGDRAIAGVVGAGSDFFYGLGSEDGVIERGRAAALGIIDAVETGADTIFNVIDQSIEPAVDYTNQFIGVASDAAQRIVSFTSGVAQDFGGAVQGFGANLQTGMDSVLARVTDGIDQAYQWTKRGFDNVVNMNKEILRSVMASVSGNIKTTLDLVQLVITVLEQVNEIFENLVSKINDAFVFVGQLFQSVGTFLLDLAGSAISFGVDFSKSVAQQLQNVEGDLQGSSGFYGTVGAILEEIANARTSASLIEYASQTIGVTKEIFFKWSDVIQPISNIQGGDSSFRIFQMGDVFAEKLYFVTIYQGELVTVDDINLTASRIPLEGEVVPGGILEADIPLFREQYDNGTFIDGLYYASFSTDDTYEWFGDTSVPVKVESPIPGDYLTRIDANFTAPSGTPHDGEKLNNTWAEITELFDESFTVDAFPTIEILTDYTEAIVGGQRVPLLISVENSMFSKPIVDVEFRISTDFGFVIANRKIANIVLPSVDEGTEVFELEWQPLETTPAGEYDLLVTIVEPNGDTSTVATEVTIRGRTFLEQISGFFLSLFGSLLGFFGLGAFIVNKKKTGKQSKNIFTQKILKSSLDCSTNDILSGNCSVKLKLDCDPKTGSCKLDL